MKDNSVKLDLENLKKLAPLCVVIGAAVTALSFLPLGVIGGFWNLVVLAAWLVSGGLYANMAAKTNSGGVVSLALNGALAAGLALLARQILTSLYYLMQGAFVSMLSAQSLATAMVLGAVGAVAWFAYRTNAAGKSSRAPRKKSASAKRGK